MHSDSTLGFWTLDFEGYRNEILREIDQENKSEWTKQKQTKHLDWMNLETRQTCFHQWKKTCVFLKFETPRFVFDVTHRTLPWQHHLFRLAKKEAENAAKAKSWERFYVMI